MPRVGAPQHPLALTPGVRPEASGPAGFGAVTGFKPPPAGSPLHAGGGPPRPAGPDAGAGRVRTGTLPAALAMPDPGRFGGIAWGDAPAARPATPAQAKTALVPLPPRPGPAGVPPRQAAAASTGQAPGLPQSAASTSAKARGLFSAMPGWLRPARVGAAINSALRPYLGPPPRLPNRPMPPTAVFKQTASMLRAFDGEQTGKVWGLKVTYVKDEHRQFHKLEFNPEDKRFYLPDPAGGKPRRFDTADAATTFGQGAGRAIFVVDPMDGGIYVSKFQAHGKFHHSSLMGLDPATGQARPVAMAGELTMKDGQLVGDVSRRSGHYMPTVAMAQNFDRHLRAMGVPPTFTMGKGF